ncbi:hypothetical protein L211DRAFT_848055 [Terfezia boudieri ATCC MYA-4762]|uniref:Uncharacterized protein n=1 Tax=Terfezia boudieri ATCC MYA-4762 TaxID=1051890 RepID=A0A3N4LQH9_9PEZI|nr:hypothetical protein L211DRAFT_848055 [Terfezia boudieri ATCC MYA-4762]
MEKLYRPTVPSFQPQQNPLQRPRDFSNSTPAPMSAFLNFPYENSSEFSSWAPPINGNIMNLNNGPPFQRHMASPAPPPLMNPLFHHNGFAAAPPPQHFSSAGPVGGFQQPQFANGMISPIHSPDLGPVLPHMHNHNGNTFPPQPSYHNIHPPPGSLGNRNPNQIPPPQNFASFNSPVTGVMHHGSRENGVGHHLGPFLTPPVSAPSSPSPPPPHMINGYNPTPPPPHGMQSLFPLIMSPNHVHNSHMYRSVPTLPQLNFPSAKPRTVATRTNKSLTPNLAKSTLATSTVISRNDPAPTSTNNDQSTSTILNPNATSFQPKVISPAIVSSTPPLKRTVTPPTKTRTHPFNPLSSQFIPSTCSTPSREEQTEKRASGKFNPGAPSFVPETPPLPARSSPPPNAPTGPASLVPRTNPPPGSSSIPPYPKLPHSPPTGPKADRNMIPPRPIIGLGIGMVAANEIQERGLPATTPLGPKSMSTPTGPRAERPLSRNLSYSRTYSGSESYNPREKHVREPVPTPTVAFTRISGIDMLVPTGPAKMLADLPPAAKIPDVPTAPAAMLKSMESGSQNGSEDGTRGRPLFLSRSSSHTYTTRSVNIRHLRGAVSQSRKILAREHDDSRNVSKSRDGSGIPGIMVEVTFHDQPNAGDKVAVLTEEPESYDIETMPANEVEKAVQEQVEVSAAVTIQQEPVKEFEESGTVIEEALFVGEPEKSVAVVELPLDESVLPEVEAADFGIAIEAIAPAPGLVQQSVFTADDADEDTVIPVLDKVEEIAAAPPIPSIQIESDDLSRKEVDLENDLDTNLDLSPGSRAATTPSTRLSELSKKRRKEEGDDIVSMMIEDGVVIVPTRDIPSPTAQMKAMAKKRLVKGKNKDVIAPVREEVTLAEEAEKDKKSPKKGKKIRRGKKEEKVAIPTTEPVRTTAPIATDEVALETDMKPPVNQKPVHRGAVVSHGIVHQDGTSSTPTIQKNSESDVGFLTESKAEGEEVDVIVHDPKDEEEPTTPETVLMEGAEKEAPKITLEENDNETEHDGGVKLDAADALPTPVEDPDDQPVKLTQISSDNESLKGEQDDEDAAVHVEEEPLPVVEALRIVKPGTPVQPLEEEPVIVLTLEPEAVIEEIAAIEKESPVALDEESVAIVQEPVSVLEEPIAVVRELVAIIEEPIAIAVEPAAVVKESVAVVEVPVAVVEEPVPFVEEPVTFVEEPVTFVEEPIAVVEEPIAVVEQLVFTSEESPVVIELLEDLLVPTVEPPNTEEVVKEAAFFEPRHMHTGEIAVSINSIIDALASCKDTNSLSGTLETYSRVSKPGTQEERLFRELHHYAAIAGPTKNDNGDNRSTRSKSSMRSVRSFFKRRAEAYPQLLSSTTNRIKAILPPFLSMTAAPAINTIPTSGTITLTDHRSPMASTNTGKSQRSRFFPKMTMSLLSRSVSTKCQQNVAA